MLPDRRNLEMSRAIINVDVYDRNKFKMHANMRWLLSFIPSYHKDKVKNNIRKNLHSLPLPPKTADGIWRDIIAILVSCEAYRCACLAIFGPPGPLNHWDVIQSLSRHGFYVVNHEGTGVVQTALLTAAPFQQEAHIAVVDCLMQAYSRVLVTITRVVAAVKRIGPFNASQELPYDLEDSLVLWLNKVCGKVRGGWEAVSEVKREEVRLGRVPPSEDTPLPHIPTMEDLVQDIGDGQCLGILLHYYLPKDLPIDALKFGRTLLQSEKASNMAAVRFTIMTVLGMDWFPMRLDLFFHPCYLIKPNLIVFMSELFWKFEVKGDSRNKLSSDRWLKEEERSGTSDMNCAAAATEIALQLEKCPVSLGAVSPKNKAFYRSDSDSDTDLDILNLPPIAQPAPRPVIPDVELRLICDTPRMAPEPRIVPEPRIEPEVNLTKETPEQNIEVEEVLETHKYFSTASSPSFHTASELSQSLGSMGKVSTPDVLRDKDSSPIKREGTVTITTPALLQPATAQYSSASSNDEPTDKAAKAQDEDKENEPSEKQNERLGSVVTKPAGVIKPPAKRRKSGEELVEEMRVQEDEKREFYTNIAKWVATVEKECTAEAIPPDELLSSPALTRSIKKHFSKQPMATVGRSFVIKKDESKEDAENRGIPVIPVTPAPAPPQKIKEDYLMTVHERDEAIRKRKEEEERKIKAELDRKRLLEEKLAEEKRIAAEDSDNSSKSTGSKKGKKGTKKGSASKKEGKSFPRRPNSGGSNSSTGSTKPNKTGKAGKSRSKDDISVKSEKIMRSKTGKVAPKRRAKSARDGRPGKCVSFIDETPLETPVVEIVQKEEPPPEPECPHKKDTRVIGDDPSAVKKSKLAFFVALEDTGMGLGSGPIHKQPVLYPDWGDQTEDSLLTMRNDNSDLPESGTESSLNSSESEGEEMFSHVIAENVTMPTGPVFTDVSHIIDSIKPQFGSEVAYVYEKGTTRHIMPLPTDPKQLILHIQLQEKRNNIEKHRNVLREKWVEERSQLNRHVFYEALKKTKDVGQQADGDAIRDEIGRSDSLEELITHSGVEEATKEPFNPTQGNPRATPTHIKPQSLLQQAISDTEAIFSEVPVEEATEEATKEKEIPVVEAEQKEEPKARLVAVFSDHGDVLSTTISPSTLPSTPSTMQYFYGFTDLVTDNKVSEKRQQFLISQRKKQEELKARRELELQRKLEATRQQTHVEAELRRDEGNLVTKCRAKSARVRVVNTAKDDLITTARCKSATARKTLMAYKTPEPDHMFPDKSHRIQNGGTTYRKHAPKTTTPQKRNQRTETPKKAPDCEENKQLKRKDSSPKPPTLPLFVAPSAKSNCKVVCNAICWTCLSGVPDRTQQIRALQAISKHDAQQFVILFRDSIAKKFRGIYIFNMDTDKLTKIFGVGPKTITHNMLYNLYKYDSGSRSFSLIPTLNFSPTVDGISINNTVWKRAGVMPS